MLEAALERHLYDRDLLLALFERDAGRQASALAHARRPAELEPARSDIQQLVRELDGPH